MSQITPTDSVAGLVGCLLCSVAVFFCYLHFYYHFLCFDYIVLLIGSMFLRPILYGE